VQEELPGVVLHRRGHQDLQGVRVAGAAGVGENAQHGALADAAHAADRDGAGAEVEGERPQPGRLRPLDQLVRRGGRQAGCRAHLQRRGLHRIDGLLVRRPQSLVDQDPQLRPPGGQRRRGGADRASEEEHPGDGEHGRAGQYHVQVHPGQPGRLHRLGPVPLLGDVAADQHVGQAVRHLLDHRDEQVQRHRDRGDRLGHLADRGAAHLGRGVEDGLLVGQRLPAHHVVVLAGDGAQGEVLRRAQQVVQDARAVPALAVQRPMGEPPPALFQRIVDPGEHRPTGYHAMPARATHSALNERRLGPGHEHPPRRTDRNQHRQRVPGHRLDAHRQRGTGNRHLYRFEGRHLYDHGHLTRLGDADHQPGGGHAGLPAHGGAHAERLRDDQRAQAGGHDPLGGQPGANGRQEEADRGARRHHSHPEKTADPHAAVVLSTVLCPARQDRRWSATPAARTSARYVRRGN
jgi:hypothetical protein